MLCGARAFLYALASAGVRNNKLHLYMYVYRVNATIRYALSRGGWGAYATRVPPHPSSSLKVNPRESHFLFFFFFWSFDCILYEAIVSLGCAVVYYITVQHLLTLLCNTHEITRVIFVSIYVLLSLFCFLPLFWSFASPPPNLNAFTYKGVDPSYYIPGIIQSCPNASFITSCTYNQINFSLYYWGSVKCDFIINKNYNFQFNNILM